VITIAVILSTTVVIELSKNLDLMYLFISVGCITIILIIILMFGLKDVPRGFSSKLPKKQLIAKGFKDLRRSMLRDWSLLIAIMGNFVTKITSINGYLFGTLLLQDSFDQDVDH
jgi:hypothetical protein